MDNIEKIEALLKKRNGIITTSEVEDLGINSRILTLFFAQNPIYLV